MCTEVQRKEVKLKEVGSLGDLYAILTKERGLRALKDDKSQEGTRKIMGLTN